MNELKAQAEKESDFVAAPVPEPIVEEGDEYPYVWTVTRTLAAVAVSNHETGIVNQYDLGLYLTDLMIKGNYELFDTHHLGISPDGHQIAYILRKKE